MILKEIREKVRIIKKYYPDLSAYEILEELKVVTGFLDNSIETNLPEGCYFKLNGVKFVLINPSVQEHKRNQVYAHELGHVLLHPNVNTLRLEDYDKIFVKKLELQADTFCSEFLLHDNIFEEYEGCSIYEIAKTFGVTSDIVNIKYDNLLKLNLINTQDFSVM